VNILLCCFTLRSRTGLELYTRDVALELQRRGHTPCVFTSTLGPVASELAAAGISVTTSLKSLRWTPDIIHGNYHRTTLAAVLRYPQTLAIFVCHAHDGWTGSAPDHPRIARYSGVSRLCVERLISQGIPAEQVGLSLNSVDTARFLPRSPLPPCPRRALLFSNYARASTQLIPVTEACATMGLELDVVGAGVGNSIAKPEHLLGQYDIVFAKAKAALEAMSVGAAVVLCDFGGVGPMVTAAEFDRLRPLNFGFEALTSPLTATTLQREITRYDAQDAGAVQQMVRSDCSLQAAVDKLIQAYEEVIGEGKNEAGNYTGKTDQAYRTALLRDKVLERLLTAWMRVPLRHQDMLCRLPGVARTKAEFLKRVFR
jgi:hypothetical protein